MQNISPPKENNYRVITPCFESTSDISMHARILSISGCEQKLLKIEDMQDVEQKEAKIKLDGLASIVKMFKLKIITVCPVNIEINSTRPSQGERACIKGLENVLFEILD